MEFGDSGATPLLAEPLNRRKSHVATALLHICMVIKNYRMQGSSGTGDTSVATELERREYQVLHGDRPLAYVVDPVAGQPLSRN